jgi:hypothetical protein
VAGHPPPDITIARIDGLLDFDLPTLLAADRWQQPSRQNVIPFQTKGRRSVATSSPSGSERP